MSDTASFDDNGRVLGFASKVNYRADLRLAIGRSGRFATGVENDVEEWLWEQPKQTTALSNILALIDRLHALDKEAKENGALIDNPIEEGFRLTVALWDDIDRHAKAAVVASNPRMAEGLRIPPGVLRPVRTMFSPPLRAEQFPGHSFCPERDAAELAALQRAFRDDRSTCRVAGGFEAVRVRAEGIEKREVGAWPDLIGSPADPGAKFELAGSPSSSLDWSRSNA